ncbi:MAG: hypothetical protein U1E94_04425 [Agitococcus sp.]
MSINYNFLKSRFFIYIIGLIFCYSWVLYAGKDINWDSLNYHLYAGYSAFENRLDKDYFAASLQQYLNPYSHLPFYLMVKFDLNSKIVALVFTMFHALNLLIIYEISVTIHQKKNIFIPVFLSLFFAFTNPVFLVELGSTFNEISTSVFVLFGWLLLVKSFYKNYEKIRFLVFWAGVSIGVSVGLKITNIYFSITALPLILLLNVPKSRLFSLVAIFGLGGFLGILVSTGYWFIELWSRFSNPVFPLFNNIFLSKDFLTEPIKHYRFIPHSMSDILLRPFLIFLPIYDIHTETLAPDSRYALAFIILIVGAVAFLFKGIKLFKTLISTIEYRVLVGLFLGFLLSWCIWLPLSANSRYFLPMACLLSVVLGSIFYFIVKDSKRLVFYILGTIITVQSLQIIYAVEKRWSGTEWGNLWFELDIPQKLQEKPYLYLSPQINSLSFLAPYLNKDSRFINITGQYALGHGVAGGEKAYQIIKKSEIAIRTLYQFKMLNVDSMWQVPQNNIDFHLYRFGLKVNPQDCAYIKMKNPTPSAKLTYYLSCSTEPLVLTTQEKESYLLAESKVTPVFDALERVCPDIFQPKGVLLESDGKTFMRNYINTDVQLIKLNDNMVRYRNLYLNTEIDIGDLNELSQKKYLDSSICPHIKR